MDHCRHDGRTHRAWDAPLYWQAGYPAAILLSGLFGWLWPLRPWRWAAVVMASQMLVMIARGAGFSLLPLGLVLIAVLSLPPTGVATLAAWLRR